MLKESLRAEDDPCKALSAWGNPQKSLDQVGTDLYSQEMYMSFLLFKSFICGILIYPPLKGSTIATRQTPGWIISEFKQPIVRDHGTFPLTTGWPGMLYGNILRLNLP